MTPPRELTTDSERGLTSGPDLQASGQDLQANGQDLQANGLVLQAAQLAAFPESGGSRLAPVAPAVEPPASQANDLVATAYASPTPSGPADQGITIHRGVHDPTGQRQARQDAQRLKHLPNDRFVERIEHDCAVGPHLEWGIAGGTILTKSLAKGWILGKAGESMGPAAKVGGIGVGVALGTVTGFYTAYETADMMENSCRAHAYEERLAQTQGGSQTDDSPGLDPISQTYDIERGFPSVRTVVDYANQHVQSVLGRPPADPSSFNYGRAMAHANLDDASYIAWAHRASAVPASTQVERGIGFTAVGLGGGVFAASKLHLGLAGGLVAASGGALIGLGLDYLGIAAKQDTTLAQLLKDRLMSHPKDRPRH